MSMRWLVNFVKVAALSVMVAMPLLAAVPVHAIAAPNSMAAIGDSFTSAAYSGGSCAPTGNCPANSWSTGTTANVQSHYQRLQAIDPAITGHAFNNAVSGRKMDYFVTEAQTTISQNPQYVTVLLGINDYCRESTAAMTSVATFKTNFINGMNKLATGLTNSKVFVSSLPDPYRLWQVLKDNPAAQNAWSSQDVCQAMLLNPTSTAQADNDRRAMVRQRVVDFNQALADACATYTQCRFDNNATFNWQYSAGDMNTTDYFHPSVQGETNLAAVTWAATYSFDTTPPPPPPPTGNYAVVVTAAHPVSYWRLANTSGTTALDSIGGSNPGTYKPGYTLAQAGATTDGDTAVKLNGTAGYITVPNSVSLSTGDNFTLEAWIKPAKLGITQGLFSKDYQVYLDGTNHIVFRKPNVGTIATSTATIPDLNYHHIVITKAGATVGLYIDGQNVTGAAVNRAITNSTAALLIGNGSGYFNGTLDDIAIYNYALAPAAVASHYTSR